MHPFKLALFSLMGGMLMLGNAAFAQWYEAQGQAGIENGDIAKARQAAIDNAVEAALVKAGANAKFYRTYTHGQAGPRFLTDMNYPVKRTTVLEEQATTHAVTLRVRVFIDEELITMNKCSSAIRHSVLPLTINFAEPTTYAGAAGLEEFNEELSYLIYSRLKESGSLKVLDHRPLRFLRTSGSRLTDDDIKGLKSLSMQEGVQYVITGTIRSLSLSQSGSNPLSKLFYTPTRTLDFTLNIYDAVDSSLVFSKNYRIEGDWTFKQGEFVDVRSESFLASSYGQRVLTLSNEASLDIIDEIACTKAKARVIEVKGTDLIVGLGSENGVREGSDFTVVHTYQTHDRRQRSYDVGQQGSVYRVAEVYPHSCRLTPMDFDHGLVSVSADDIVLLN